VGECDPKRKSPLSQIDDKYLNLLRSRYRQASKKEKTAIRVHSCLQDIASCRVPDKPHRTYLELHPAARLHLHCLKHPGLQFDPGNGGNLERRPIDPLPRVVGLVEARGSVGGGGVELVAWVEPGLPVEETLAVIEQALEMSYYTAGQQELTHRVVEPLRLEYRRDIPYLVAFCHRAQKVNRLLPGLQSLELERHIIPPSQIGIGIGG